MVGEELDGWFSVRCLFRDEIAGTYEERITVWKARDLGKAIFLAEEEAAAYASVLDGVSYAGLAQGFSLSDAPVHGSEVFSLMRDSELSKEEYISRFLATGGEHQEEII